MTNKNNEKSVLKKFENFLSRIPEDEFNILVAFLAGFPPTGGVASYISNCRPSDRLLRLEKIVQQNADTVRPNKLIIPEGEPPNVENGCIWWSTKKNK